MNIILLSLAAVAGASAFTPIANTHPFIRTRICALEPLFACRTAAVARVVENTKKAAQQVQLLEDALMGQVDEKKKYFMAKIAEFQAASKIMDARPILDNMDIKTEYTSEFSLDKITDVIVNALKVAAIAATAANPATPSIALSPAAITAYTDLVNTVAEAAKSSSTSAASMSFSATRVATGIYAYLFAASTNIQDNETFGKEAVTTTAVFYQMIESIDAIRNEKTFELALIEADNLIKMKKLQAALTDDLVNGKIDDETYEKKDKRYSEFVNSIQARLDAITWVQVLRLFRATDFKEEAPSSSEELVRSSLDALQGKRKDIDPEDARHLDYAINVCNERLDSGYYQY